MAKFLITGANGQVGYWLAKKLQNNSEFLALTRQELDIADKDAVNKIVSNFHPDVVINASAYTAVDKAESEPEIAHAVNVVGAKNLAKISREIGAKMIHISTDYVFDGQGDVPYKETDETNPQGVYGSTKLEGEIAVLQENPSSVILRTAWVFGEHGHNFVKTMIRLAKQKDSLGIVADQIGSPTYAGDIADTLIAIAYRLIAGDEHYGIYHYSGHPYVSWADFAREIFEQAFEQGVIDKKPVVNDIATTKYPTPAKRPANSRLDLQKIYQDFGIKPSDWQNALKNINEYVS